MSARTRVIFGPLIVTLAGVIMMLWTWGTWVDPIVDYGREIYVPWRLANGEVLYRDIVSYFNGPLSPYLHALLFKLFGVSLRTVVIFNLLVIVALSGMMYHLLRRIAGVIAATTAGVAFFTVFAFSQYVTASDYNYVAPYSYELTHGLTLSAAALCCFDQWTRTRARRWLALAGFIVGLVALTKAEIFLAIACAIGLGAALSMWVWRRPVRAASVDLLALAGAAMVPVVLAWGMLALAMTARTAIGGMLGAWRYVGNRKLLALPFFMELSGRSNPTGYAFAMVRAGACYVIGFGAIGVFAYGIDGDDRKRRVTWAVATFAIVAAVGWFYWLKINWNVVVRPLPLMLACLAAIVFVMLMRVRNSRADATTSVNVEPTLLTFAMIMWAGALLAKIALNVNVLHYGFALSMPGTMLGIALLIGWIPAWIDRVGGNGAIMRAAAAAVVAVACYAHIRWCGWILAPKTFVVAPDSADQFRADPRAIPVNALLERLAQKSDDRDTLVVVPEGLIMNFLARRVNPTGQLNFTPPALIMYGEDAMLEAFRMHPPDFIALTSVNSSEYGARDFGFDYAKLLGQWIAQNYTVIDQFRTPVINRSVFEIRLLQKKKT